jgi:hypothetical protein
MKHLFNIGSRDSTLQTNNTHDERYALCVKFFGGLAS